MVEENTEYDEHDLKSLQEIFVGHSIDELKQALISSDNDLELATMMLLSASVHNMEINEDFLQDDNQDIVNPSEVIHNDDIYSVPLSNDETKYCSTDDNIEQKENLENVRNFHNVWNSNESNIQQIINYTGISNVLASKIFFQNNMNIILAIINLINSIEYDFLKYNTNELDIKDDEKEKKSDTTIQKKGRVQGLNGYAHVKSNNISSFKILDNQKDTKKDKKVKNILTNPYIFNPIKFSELQDIIAGDNNLRSIDPKFIKNAFKFYCGNIENVLMICLLVLDNNLTFETYPDIDAPEIILEATSKIPKTFNYNTSSNRKKNNLLSCEGNSTLFNNNKLDFHGFQPQEAVRVLKTFLNKWWLEEISARELDGGALGGSLARFVMPITVVTGRGIHSVGGFSKVKMKVQQFLEGSKYIYDESPSFFIVRGKKC